MPDKMIRQKSYPIQLSIQNVRHGEPLCERLARLFSAYFSYFLAAVFLVSLGVRLLALFYWCNSLYGDFLVWDERVYHGWASALSVGTSEVPVVCDFTPLYAYIMALVYKVFSINIFYVRMLNIVFGVATCILIYFIGRDLAGRTAGFFACLIASLYKPFIFFSVVLMKTSLSLFLFALVFYFFISLMNRFSLIKMLLLGFFAGLLLNVRANCIFMIPIMPAAILTIHLRQGALLKTVAALLVAYAAGVSVSVVPFVARNYRMSGEFAMTATGAFNFYMGYHPDNPSPYYRPVPFASSSTARQAAQFVVEASRRANRKLSTKEASDYWTAETLGWALENPKSFIEKTILKTLALFNRFEAADNYDIGFISNSVGFFRWPFFEIWMLLPFGMAGMAVTARTSGEFNALHLVAASYAVTLVVIFTNVRIRMPLMIVLIPLAVIGVRTFVESIVRGSMKTAAGYASVLLLFFTVAFWPIEGAGDLTAHYNTLAANLYAKGQRAEALGWWEMSSGMNGAYSPFADLSLSEHHFRQGDPKEALRRLSRISDRSLAAAQKYAKMGDVLMKQKNASAAIEAYEASLAVNSGQENVIGKLSRIYRRIDTETAERMKEKKAYIASFYQPIQSMRRPDRSDGR